MQGPPLNDNNFADPALNTDQLINKFHARYIGFLQRHTMPIPAIHRNISRAGGYSQVLLITDSNNPTHPRQCPSPCLHPPTQKTLYLPTPTIHRVTEFEDVSIKQTMQTFIIEEDLCTSALKKTKLFFRSFSLYFR